MRGVEREPASALARQGSMRGFKSSFSHRVSARVLELSHTLQAEVGGWAGGGISVWCVRGWHQRVVCDAVFPVFFLVAFVF